MGLNSRYFDVILPISLLTTALDTFILWNTIVGGQQTATWLKQFFTRWPNAQQTNIDGALAAVVCLVFESLQQPCQSYFATLTRAVFCTPTSPILSKSIFFIALMTKL